MRVITSLTELALLERPIVWGSGVFDGFHIGHQAVLAHAREVAATTHAQLAALTFHPHPACVLRPEACPKFLTHRAYKHRLLANEGLDWLIELPFTRDFAQLSAEDFVQELMRLIPGKLRAWCAGENWSFGHQRSGNMELLHALGTDAGFAVQTVPSVKIDGAVVSSTRIRQALAAGNLAEAQRCLGRPFAVVGTVQSGAHLGRQLGFPTLNLHPEAGQQLPPCGVYAGLVLASDSAALTAPQLAAINLGYRPTVHPDRPTLLLEAHLLDWSGDLYGQEVEVQLLHPVRPEKKFASFQALRNQISQDIQAVRDLLQSVPPAPRDGFAHSQHFLESSRTLEKSASGWPNPA